MGQNYDSFSQSEMFDSNATFTNNSEPIAPLLAESLDEYKTRMRRREKVVTNQGDFIAEATKRFDELDTERDGKLTKEELATGTASNDKRMAKVANVLLNNREVIAQDKDNITMKDLASLNTQRSELLQERKTLKGLSSEKLDKTYNAANQDKMDDLTESELNSRLKNGKLSKEEKDQVSYLLSNFEIIDNEKDGSLSTQDIREYAAGRLARTANLQAWDDSLDTQTKKVWYEKVRVRKSPEEVPQVPASGTAGPGSDTGRIGIGASAGGGISGAAGGEVQGAGAAAEGAGRPSQGPARPPKRRN